jgi:tRNA (uracil-5-)-methyltransferase
MLNNETIAEDKMEFFAGRAEEILPPIVRDIKATKIIGIVDPPRSGLHRDVLRALRCCKGLDRLVYVSCNAESQMRDLQFLCYETKKNRPAPPFKPIKAVGADLFPHTSHIESIILLERCYD